MYLSVNQLYLWAKSPVVKFKGVWSFCRHDEQRADVPTSYMVAFTVRIPRRQV
jgi:hypothetical protein